MLGLILLGLPLAVAQAPAEAPVVTAYVDPPPGYYDPPPGYYGQPDGSVQYIDPPPGHYDPPAGYYAVPPAPLPQPVQPPAPVVAPLPPPSDEQRMDDWLAKRRKLRIGLGVSAAMFTASTAAFAIGLQTRDRCEVGPCDAVPVGMILSGIAMNVTAVFTIVYVVRVAVHARKRPQRTSRLQVVPGGLQLRI